MYNYNSIFFIQQVDDPSGNSFLETREKPDIDPNLSVVHYTRSPEQNQLFGISSLTEVRIVTTVNFLITDSL